MHLLDGSHGTIASYSYNACVCSFESKACMELLSSRHDCICDACIIINCIYMLFLFMFVEINHACMELLRVHSLCMYGGWHMHVMQ